jgi:pyrroloquinoline-quinone synthase
VGDESLLLSEKHPAQRCRYSQQLPVTRSAANLVASHHRPRRPKRRRGRNWAWLRLAEACGVDRDQLGADPLPGVRFAVGAYVHFARTAPWPVAIASSLTEMFAPDLMAQRLAAFQKHYPWVPEWGFDYFRKRLVQAPQDSEEALAITLKWCDNADLQTAAAVQALHFKCDVLWSMLDAIDAVTY